MALHLMPENENGWIPKVITSSATQDRGIDVFWEKAFDFEKLITLSKWKTAHRKEQMHYWARKSVQDLLLAKLDHYLEAIAQGLAEGKLPEEVARDIVN